jgi:hypothetical protein
MSSFEKKLNDILSGSDIDKAIDKLPDGDEEEETKPPEELVPVEYEKKGTSLDIPNADLSEDYNFARSNLYGLIGKSNASLELALRIAQMSEHPRALEVASQLMKTSSDMTKELIKLQKEVEGNSSSAKGETPKGNYTQINNYNNYSTKDIDQILDGYADDDEKQDEGEDSSKED